MPKKPTIHGLQADLKAANEEAKGYMNQAATLRAELRTLEENLKVSREHFADLKQRLVAAEQANQFMRGYVARVQEDDTVREDLVTVGEPGGEQQMVPKRKPTTFERPDDFSSPRSHGMGIRLYREREQKPRHWITY